MNYYYLDAGNQPAGPQTLDEIRRLAAAGQIPANPYIAAVGTSQWEPLHGHAAAGPGAGLEQILPRTIAWLVELVRPGLSATLLNQTLELARRAGHYVIAAGLVLGIAYAVYVAVRNASAWVLVSSVVLFICLAVAQFVARQFLAANEALFTVTRMSTPALLDGLALLGLLAAGSSVVTAVVVWIRYGAWQTLAPAVLVALLWTAFAAIALHPETVRVEFGASSGGEQVVGLLAFLCKALLRLVPLGFFLVAALGTLGLLLSFFEYADYVLSLIPHPKLPLPVDPSGPGGGFGAIAALIFACLVPLFAHLLFILASLPLDLWRAILTVPAKLDALKR